MNLSNVTVRRQASAVATIPARPGIVQRGDSTIGFNETLDLSAANIAWHRNVKFFAEMNGTGENGALIESTADGVVTLTAGSAGTHQVESATCVGTITLAGTVIFTVTSARFAEAVSVAVTVALSDTAAQWATKARAALAANATIAAYFAVTNPSSGVVALTSIDPYPNDATLNIAITAGTATGITAAPTSANTAAGVGGTVITPSASAVDIHGDVIPGAIARYIRFHSSSVGGGVLLSHASYCASGIYLHPGAVLEMVSRDGTPPDIFQVDPWEITSVGEGEVDIVCYATEA